MGKGRIVADLGFLFLVFLFMIKFFENVLTN